MVFPGPGKYNQPGTWAALHRAASTMTFMTSTGLTTCAGRWGFRNFDQSILDIIDVNIPSQHPIQVVKMRPKPRQKLKRQSALISWTSVRVFRASFWLGELLFDPDVDSRTISLVFLTIVVMSRKVVKKLPIQPATDKSVDWWFSRNETRGAAGGGLTHAGLTYLRWTGRVQHLTSSCLLFWN